MKTVKSIVKFAKKVISVDSSANIEKIQTIFIANDISLLPILDQNKRKNVGTIKLKGIIKKRMISEELNLNELKEDKLPEVDIDVELSTALSKLKNVSGVLIRNESKEYTHLITPRVVANFLEEYTSDFRGIYKLETKIRQILGKLDSDLVKDYNGEVKKIEKLSFGDYIPLISKHWDKLPLKIYDKSEFIRMTKNANEMRNATFHFRELEDTKIKNQNSIKGLNRLLKNID